MIEGSFNTLMCTVTLLTSTLCSFLIFLKPRTFSPWASEVIITIVQRILISEPIRPPRILEFKQRVQTWMKKVKCWRLDFAGRQTIDWEDFNEFFPFHRPWWHNQHQESGTALLAPTEKSYFLVWAFGSKSCFSDFALIFKLHFFQIVRRHL